MLTVQAPSGMPEVTAGTDLSALLMPLLGELTWPDGSTGVADTDIVVLASKIVAKAEGRLRAATSRDEAIDAETVRVVATRTHPDGSMLKIVENPQGLVMAAAGVDASNVHPGTVLLLPEDPDASARVLRRGLHARLGSRPAVLITDTVGRPWRRGVADIAIGAAGVQVLDDLRGQEDSHGQELAATIVNVADEIAAAADLVRGKVQGRPVAIVRGMGHRVTREDGDGARSLQRPAAEDLFRTGG